MVRRKGGPAAYGADDAAREQLILQHLPLVHHVIGRLAMGLPGVLDREDLVAHGVVGLIQACDRFDASRGIPFAAWATIRIRGAIIDAVRVLDVVDPATRQKIRSLRATTSELTTALGRFPSDAEVQAAMGLRSDEYASLLDAASCSTISIDALADGEEAPLAALCPRTEDADDPAERGARRAMIGEALRRLDERERLVLALYYVEDLTLQEVASVIGVHKSVVVRLHSRAILKLRALLGVDDEQISTGEVTDAIHTAQSLAGPITPARAASRTDARSPVGGPTAGRSARPAAPAALAGSESGLR